MWLKILAVGVGAFLVNIPMGMRRERSRKLSWQWMFWIHASIPVIIALRVWLRLPAWVIPLNIAAAVLGQVVGGALEKQRTGERG